MEEEEVLEENLNAKNFKSEYIKKITSPANIRKKCFRR